MKKIIRTILLSIWGLLTIGLLLWSMVLRQEAEENRIISNEWKKMALDFIEYMDEYERNFNLLMNDSLNKIDIDSLYMNSEYYKYLEVKKDVENKYGEKTLNDIK